MVKPASIAVIEAATQISWPDWCAVLQTAGGAALGHNEIVKAACAHAPISGWWGQEVAVAYEQHIGRRLPGQMNDGSFSASVSRTIGQPKATAFAAWRDYAQGLDAVDGEAIAQTPTTSTTPIRHYWRCKFADGSQVSLSVDAKPNGKSLVVIEHRKLGKQADMARMKQAWAGLLAACFSA